MTFFPDAPAALPRSAAALGQRRAGGRAARFWLRDDDAVADTPALGRLTDWSSRHAIPVLLAVIPAAAQPALATRLAACSAITPCQHGFAHKNHAPEGEKAAEFGAHRPLADVIGDVERGSARMRRLFGGRALPVFVPPWNRVRPDLIGPLADLGFTGVSTFGPRHFPLHPKIAEINTDLDIIDWRRGRIGRPLGKLDDELAELLLAPDAAPIGILTHHLAHDAPAWDFLEALALLIRADPAARWVSAAQCHG